MTVIDWLLDADPSGRSTLRAMRVLDWSGRGAPWIPPISPSVRAAVPSSAGSAFQHWGADPREVAWHFWRSGYNSDEMMDLAAQPDPTLPIHLCGEVFSRLGAWVEGALETAEGLSGLLLGQRP